MIEKKNLFKKTLYFCFFIIFLFLSDISQSITITQSTTAFGLSPEVVSLIVKIVVILAIAVSPSLGIYLLIKGGSIKRALVLLLSGPVIYFLYVLFTQMESIFPIAASGGFIVIISFILYFFGILVGKGFITVRSKNSTKAARILFNFSAGLLILGILIIELVIFARFIDKTSSKVTPCEKEISIFDANFFSCVLTGYRPIDLSNLHDVISFWIFIVLLPAAVMFAITYGIFFGMGLHEMFGPYGKQVVSIIAFAVAMYGARQLIGIFLIELFAYGMWGIFGILIPLILANALRWIGLKFLSIAELQASTIYGIFKASDYAYLSEVTRIIENIDRALKSPNTSEGSLKSFEDTLKGIIQNLNSRLKTERDVEIQAWISELLNRANELLNLIPNLIEEKKKKSPPGVS